MFVRLKKLTTTALTLAVVATIALTAWKLNEQFQLTTPLTTFAFAAGTLLAIAYRFVNPFGWVLVLRGMGQEVDSLAATRIWLLAESRRWLPGGVWGYASRAVAAKDVGVGKTVATASMALELLVTIAAAAIVSAIGVVLHFEKLSTSVIELLENAGVANNSIVLLGTGLIAALVIAYIFRKSLVRRIAKAAKKFDALSGVKIDPISLGKSLLYLVAMTALNGFVNVALLQAFNSADVPIAAMIAATATAWIIGFLAIFSPGGILVREAALATLLLPWLPFETGFAMAILSRFAQLIAEVAGMLVAVWKPEHDLVSGWDADEAARRAAKTQRT